MGVDHTPKIVAGAALLALIGLIFWGLGSDEQGGAPEKEYRPFFTEGSEDSAGFQPQGTMRLVLDMSGSLSKERVAVVDDFYRDLALDGAALYGADSLEICGFRGEVTCKKGTGDLSKLLNQLPNLVKGKYTDLVEALPKFADPTVDLAILVSDLVPDRPSAVASLDIIEFAAGWAKASTSYRAVLIGHVCYEGSLASISSQYQKMSGQTVEKLKQTIEERLNLPNGNPCAKSGEPSFVERGLYYRGPRPVVVLVGSNREQALAQGIRLAEKSLKRSGVQWLESPRFIDILTHPNPTARLESKAMGLAPAELQPVQGLPVVENVLQRGGNGELLGVVCGSYPEILLRVEPHFQVGASLQGQGNLAQYMEARLQISPGSEEFLSLHEGPENGPWDLLVHCSKVADKTNFLEPKVTTGFKIAFQARPRPLLEDQSPRLLSWSGRWEPFLVFELDRLFQAFANVPLENPQSLEVQLELRQS